MNWAFLPFRKYAVFHGRARRKEYWLFTLFIVLVSIALTGLIAGLAGFEAFAAGELTGPALAGQGVYYVFQLAILLPSLAVTVRRLHDIGKSGWWLLIVLVPLVGALVLLFFTIQDSQDRRNRHGPNPKADE
ncbi:MAG: DUF805 domain-containing protein [Opitutales bacterium]